jgi:hypothetical protein
VNGLHSPRRYAAILALNFAIQLKPSHNNLMANFEPTTIGNLKRIY